jgi:uncharacterized secreted protein with C-terminal beta-propeller domain
MPIRRTSALATVTALVLVAGAATLLPGGAPEAAAGALRPYDDCAELLERYREALEVPARSSSRAVQEESAPDSPVAASLGGSAPAPLATAGATSDATGSGPTGTNLQERGVDEPDSAKTVGGLLYALSDTRLQVLRSGAQPTVLSTLPLGGRGAYGGELLVQGDRLLVLLPGDGGGGGGGTEPMDGGPAGMVLPRPGGSGTRLLLVDVAEPSSPRLLESLTLDGGYLSARLSGGVVRLVTSSTPTVADPEDATVEDVLPSAVRRGPQGQLVSDGPAVDCEQVHHTDAAVGASTLLVTTLDLGRDLAPVDRTAVTTAGDLVYASPDRLYVATSSQTRRTPGRAAPGVTTEVHAFDTTSPTRTRYAGSASVDGTVLGRWAFSSYAGHLRVATTHPGGATTRGSSSSVVVLEERRDSLVETGRVDDLGPDERIYAVRYFGDLATVVTFRQTDPLYVLDLGDPSDPKLLGELKVPGFSTYLHPVGDDRLLAVGHDATGTGRVTGLQVSLFDLSDRSTPVQLDRLSLGRRTTPASQDSRAFGYDPTRRLALLPLSEDGSGTGTTSSAVGIRVSESGTLEEVGRLDTPSPAQAERVLFDSEHVYAVSRSGVTAGTAADLARTGSAAFRRG